MKGVYSISWNYYKHKLGIKIIYFSVLGTMIITSLLNLFGRFYLGAHTIDQIIYGALIGFTIFIYSIFFLRPVIMPYFYKFTDRK